MPELPEVETMVRGIRPSVEGRQIVSVQACPCERRPMLIEPPLEMIDRRVRGEIIVSVRRRAKRVLLELGSGDTFVIEPRMTGLMLLNEPPSEAHLRVEWRLQSRTRGKPGPDSVTRLWFWDRRGLGTIRLLDPDQLEEALGPGRLGPDALEATDEQWQELCGRTTSAIKVALLDQKRIAGIGNLYASEILHRSGISPEARACNLKPDQIRRMAKATTEILTTAIRYEGSTLSDGTYRNALNKSGGYQNAHRVYDREGESCLTCERGRIIRIVQGQRSTFFCRVCQRKPRRG
jgi:formamidopyrimidine-DNA glycosylase